MATDYDEGDSAALYRKAKNTLPLYRIDTFSLLELVGDVSGKKVLDVACGEGHFTRLLRKAGAATVVGSDISERMIELARQQEDQEPLGIEYIVDDAATVVDPPQDFDVVVSAYLMVNARSRTELAGMCAGLASRLKPGGRFVTINVSPAVYQVDPAPDYRKYGLEMRLADHAYEGAPINFTLLLDDSTLQIENYYLPIEAYASELQSAGFTDFASYPPLLPPAFDSDFEPGFWDDFSDCPTFVLFDCVKA